MESIFTQLQQEIEAFTEEDCVDAMKAVRPGEKNLGVLTTFEKKFFTYRNHLRDLFLDSAESKVRAAVGFNPWSFLSTQGPTYHLRQLMAVEALFDEQMRRHFRLSPTDRYVIRSGFAVFKRPPVRQEAQRLLSGIVNQAQSTFEKVGDRLRRMWEDE